MSSRFPIRLGARSRPLLRLLFGARPENAYAELPDGGVEPADAGDRGNHAGEAELLIRFGRASFRTPLSNIERYRIEGPFVWLKAIGIRRSIRGGDVSFAGSPHGGVRMDLRQPVRWTIFRVPAVYVGADDLDSFARALQERGIPGVDARRPTATR